MAKEIVAFAWCDVCQQHDEKVPGITTPPITIGNGKPKELDLCEVHEKEVLEPLRALLNEVGQEVKPPRKGRPSSATPVVASGGVVVPGARKAYVKCLFCDATPKTKGAYGVHLNQHHDGKKMTDLDVIEQLYGGANPIEPRQEFACDQCSISYDRRSSLSGHKTNVHGASND